MCDDGFKDYIEKRSVKEIMELQRTKGRMEDIFGCYKWSRLHQYKF